VEEIVIAMRKYTVVLLLGLGVVSLLGYAASPAPVAIGFGVGVPPAFPIQWDESFSFLTAEFLPDPNLTLLFTLGTYPADFPTLYEGSGSLIVKAWVGPVALYGGGGLSIQSRLIDEAWLWSPYMNVVAGTQLWILDSFAICAQVRSLELLPPTWTLHPEVSLGVSLAFGEARPASPQEDEGMYLWIIVGLSVLTLLAYYPRS
jgi:hypothetical protein